MAFHIINIFNTFIILSYLNKIIYIFICCLFDYDYYYKKFFFFFYCLLIIIIKTIITIINHNDLINYFLNAYNK